MWSNLSQYYNQHGRALGCQLWGFWRKFTTFQQHCTILCLCFYALCVLLWSGNGWFYPYFSITLKYYLDVFCQATPEINTQITLLIAHKVLTISVFTSFSVSVLYDGEPILFKAKVARWNLKSLMYLCFLYVHVLAVIKNNVRTGAHLTKAFDMPIQRYRNSYAKRNTVKCIFRSALAQNFVWNFKF